jgi:hypothetical protein
MFEQTNQTTQDAGAVPTRIELEQLIESVVRGARRGWTEADDVDGYALRPIPQSGSGIIIQLPRFPLPFPQGPIVVRIER